MENSNSDQAEMIASSNNNQNFENNANVDNVITNASDESEDDAMSISSTTSTAFPFSSRPPSPTSTPPPSPDRSDYGDEDWSLEDFDDEEEVSTYTSDEDDDAAMSLPSTSRTASTSRPSTSTRPPSPLPSTSRNFHPEISDDSAVDYSLQYVNREREQGASASSSSSRPSISPEMLAYFRGAAPVHCRVRYANGQVKYPFQFRLEAELMNANDDSNDTSSSSLTTSSSSSSSPSPSRSASPPPQIRELTLQDFRRLLFNDRRAERSNAILVKHLKCHVCHERLGPPSEQCENGHVICCLCKRKMEIRCPFCRGNWTKYMSPLLRKLYLLTKFPCKYTEKGCDFMAENIDLLFHELNCQFKGDQ